MNPLTAHIQTYNVAVAMIYASVPDVEKLPESKRKFYEMVIALAESSKAIIEAKHEHIQYLERSNEKTKQDSYMILKKQFNSLLTLARCRGVDVELIRYID